MEKKQYAKTPMGDLGITFYEEDPPWVVDKPVWAVRWSEKGFAPKLTRFDSDEGQARAFYNFLVEAYERKGRTTRPQLLMSETRWQEQ